MLSGTDLNYAFSLGLDDVNSYDYDNYSSVASSYATDNGGSARLGAPSRESREPAMSKKELVGTPKPKVHTHHHHHDAAVPEPVAIRPASAKAAMSPQPSNSTFDTIFSSPTPEQKIQMLSMELSRQRDLMEQQRQSNVGYFDKLMSKRKDVLKFILFSLVILFALSIHHHVKHYYKAFFQTRVLTPPKEFGVRAIYPLVIIFVLWNLRVFVR